MEKRKLRILTVVVFAGVLVFGALRQNSTGRGELGEIQVAMWNLGKVDNLQLSYEYRWKQNGSAGGETMHAWADMLTGDWISEHYTTDEDGTRLYLKQFCDGRNLYHYIDWSGEWEQILPQQRENTVIPDYEMVTDLGYDVTDPTTGGVTASFAMLGDIILGEPGALVGFAGPRVIKQTIGQDLPEGFQRSEFLVDHGIIDGIITRDKMKDTMYQLIVTHKQRTGYANFDKEEDEKFDISEILKERLTSVENKTPWEKIRGTRQMTRPCALDYIDYICEDFHEIHGDRTMNDDKAIVGGIGHIDGQPVTVIAQVKGSSMTECMERNFGMPLPDGYRKALRLMKQAEKFNRPIITFVNTPGAFCGLEAEERGMGEAIARNLYEMSALKVPVLCILIGEGGSGGALAMAVGNEVWMLENAVYSILSPEGYASILWKDSNRAEEAAEVMQLTAQDLSRLGVIEKVIPEYGGADKESVPYIGKFIKMNAKEFLKKFDGMSGEEIAAARYKRFREM